MVTHMMKTKTSTPAVAYAVGVCAWLDRAWFGRVTNTGVAPEAGFMR
jgi:hypothetical protein